MGFFDQEKEGFTPCYLEQNPLLFDFKNQVPLKTENS